MAPRTVLLNPGPVTLSDRVRAALTRGDWCHREPEFAELTRALNASLAAVYPEMREACAAVLLAGSGTAAVEGMLATFAPLKRRTLVVANGVYGERMARMLAAHGRPHQVVKHDWLAAPDLGLIERTIEELADVSHLAVVHHETTTGRLNDLVALGSLCRRRGIKLLLDAVSSFGAEAIDAEAWNVAALAATANKCLHGVPGLSFVIGHRDAWAATAGSVGSVYLDLRNYFSAQHGDGFSPFTQPVQVAFALQEALAEFAEQGGWQARQRTYRSRAQRIHAALIESGVTTLLPEADYSSVLWSYRLPAGRSYPELHDRLKAEGFVIYAGQGRLGDEIFRIAHMGDITAEELNRLCAILPEAVSR